MKVFLSSTYLDLIEHRKAAHDALERIGQEVGRMEIFGARAEEATSVALDQLEKSDLVIGIYAYRYGFIPEGSDISITEQEYVHAKSKGKPVLCFVVDEDQPWSPKMMEKDAGKIRKLEDFKAKVLKEKVVDFFTTPADLGMKVATSVHNYLSEHKPIPNSQSLIPNRQSTNTSPPNPTSSVAPKNSKSLHLLFRMSPAPGAHSLMDLAASARPPSPSKPPTAPPMTSSSARFSSPPKCAN